MYNEIKLKKTTNQRVVTMIKQVKKVTHMQFEGTNSNHIAKVTVQGATTLVPDPQTTITVCCREDYEYIHQVFDKELDEEIIVKYVTKALEQASGMKYAPSKYGEEPEEIELDD